MPSFDVVSEVDQHELTNSVDQTRRELGNRFDFKGVDFGIDQDDGELRLHAESDYQVRQLLDVLQQRMTKRGIDIACLDVGKPEATGKLVKLQVRVKQGLDADAAKAIVKAVKASKLKVQTQIQGEKVRVSGKKKDDLQRVMALLREGSFGVPLQFNNFRD